MVKDARVRPLLYSRNAWNESCTSVNRDAANLTFGQDEVAQARSSPSPPGSQAFQVFHWTVHVMYRMFR